jgi:GntR family transcriptional repressor for pyruvate dehydrogenase complex
MSSGKAFIFGSFDDGDGSLLASRASPSVPNSGTAMSLRPVRRENLPSSIASQLRRQILQHELGPGDQLPGHRELAAMYSVSVGSVREAISMLISAGLVETRAGRGTFVVGAASLPRHAVGFDVSLTRKEVEELVEARAVIELELAAMAAERASPDEVAKLRLAAERMEVASASPEEYPDADVDFHLALAEAAGNRYLLRAMIDIRSLLKQDMELGAEAAIRRFGDLRPSIDSHHRLVEAVAAGDAAGAREILSVIVNRNREFVLGLYALAPIAD